MIVKIKQLRVLTLAAVLLLTTFLAGCAGNSPGGGYDSPRALVRAVHDAAISGDLEMSRMCIDPRYRDMFTSLFARAAEYVRKVDVAAKLIEKKGRKEAANRFRRKYLRIILTSPFDDAVKDGHIQWKRIDIRVEGDKARLGVDGTEIRQAARDHTGRWFVTYSKREIPARIVASSSEFIEGESEEIDTFVRKLHAGTKPYEILVACDSRKTVMTMVKEAEEGVSVQDSTVLSSIQGYEYDADLRNHRMFKTKPPTQRDWKALRKFVQTNQDIESYHVLMAIRREKPEMYASLSPDIRCRVLVRTLRFHLSDEVNGFTWLRGLRREGFKPSQKDWTKGYVPEHTRALLREGRVAVRYLAPLLKNRSVAPILWRGKGYSWSLYYKGDDNLRVCDYAYHFITAILDGGQELEPKLTDRDKGIAKLIRRIEAGS